MVHLFYTTYISVDLAHHEIVRAKVGKGDIIPNMQVTRRADALGKHMPKQLQWRIYM